MGADGRQAKAAINIGLTSRLITDDTELVCSAAQSIDVCPQLEKALSVYVSPARCVASGIRL